MIKRICFWRIRAGVPREKIDQYAKVLEDTPRFVPSIKTSAVYRNIISQVAEEAKNLTPKWDLVWETTFDTLDDLEKYMVHPYHCMTIDKFASWDTPGSIVEAVTGVRYDMDEKKARRTTGGGSKHTARTTRRPR